MKKKAISHQLSAVSSADLERELLRRAIEHTENSLSAVRTAEVHLICKLDRECRELRTQENRQ